MYYAAKHYVKIGKRTFMPGEIIHDEIPADALPRLLELGAVVAMPVYASPAANVGGRREEADMTDEEHQRDMNRQSYANQMQNMGYHPDGTPISDEDAPSGAESPSEADKDADEETSEEAFEDAPAPEIDVMDGIVSTVNANGSAKTPAKKTAKRGRQKAD